MLIAVITSIASALWLAGSLKVLHFFSLIDWSPVGFAKKWDITESAFSSWMLLILLLFIVSLIIYLLMQYSWKIPAFLTSLVIGVAFAIVAEWIIYDLPAENASFKKLSIPFIVIVVITCRFIIETAKFHYRAKRFESKLMYKDTMVE